MVELFKQLKKQTCSEKHNIDILKRPEAIIGCTISDCHRLLYFTQSQNESFYIDFIEHKTVAGYLYIIPASHLLYMPEDFTELNCISIPQSQVGDEEKLWIFQQKFKTQKSVKFDVTFISHLNTPSKGIIARIFNLPNVTRPNIPPLQYIKLADEFCNTLSQIEITHQLLVSDLVKWIATTDKTLQRICQAVFIQKPKFIIHYYLLIKITCQVIRNKQDSFIEIASDLGFKNVSSFGRYVKTLTGHTPKEIRDRYWHFRI